MNKQLNIAIQKVSSLKIELENDENYIKYTKLKEELYNKTYYDTKKECNRKLYKTISDIMRNRMKALENDILKNYKDEKERKIMKNKINLFQSDRFHALEHKSFTNFINEINRYNKELDVPEDIKPSVIYNKTVLLMKEDFKIYNKEHNDDEVSKICFLIHLYDTYVGFLKEYILSECCKALGLNVGINRDIDKKLDTDYAIDLLVYNKETKVSLALQIKPLSYKRKQNKDSVKESNSKMNSFRMNYKSIPELEEHTLINTVYILYNQNNGLEGYCTVAGNVFVDLNNILNYTRIDENSVVNELMLAYSIKNICNR